MWVYNGAIKWGLIDNDMKYILRIDKSSRNALRPNHANMKKECFLKLIGEVNQGLDDDCFSKHPFQITVFLNGEQYSARDKIFDRIRRLF